MDADSKDGSDEATAFTQEDPLLSDWCKVT